MREKKVMDFSQRSFGWLVTQIMHLDWVKMLLGTASCFGPCRLGDLANKNYIHHERVVREGWQARAGQDTLDLKVAGIQASMHENGQKHRLTTLFPDGAKLELELTPEKPLIRFGERGLSRKGDGASSVSWYWSYTRLKAEGILREKEPANE